MFKSTPYGNLLKLYPTQISNLRTLVAKEHDLFQQVSNMSKRCG